MSEPSLKLPLAREPYRTALSTSRKRANTAQIFSTVSGARPYFMESRVVEGSELRRHLPEGRVESLQNVFFHLLRNLRIVSVRGLVAIINHFHPGFAILNQIGLEGSPSRALRADDVRDALFLQVVIQDVPGQFVRELEALDQPLPLKVGQIA